MTNVIKIEPSDRDMVQRANIDSESMANLISVMISNKIDVGSERFLDYEKRYKDAYWTFEQAKKEIERKYLGNINVVSWSLNYATCELTYNA